jgi:hypothetical protein
VGYFGALEEGYCCVRGELLAIFPVVVGCGATGENSEVVGSFGSGVVGICPYFPHVAVSDSVVGGEVECPRGGGEGVDVDRGGWVGKRIAVGG